MKKERRSWQTSGKGRNTRRKRKQRLPNNQIRSVIDHPYLFCCLTIDSQTPGVNKPVTGSTFEDVLYGDDSDSEAEDDEEDENSRGRKKRGVHTGARLRVDNDQPMDLLESAVTQVTGEV